MSAPSRCEFGAPTARAAPGEGRRVLREARRGNGPSGAESLCTRAFRGTDRLTMNCSRAEVKRFSATIGPFQRLTFRHIVCPIGALYRMRHRTHVRRQLRNYLLLLIPVGLLAWIALLLGDLLDA